MINKELLEKFRDLEIDKEELYARLPQNTQIKDDEIVEIKATNLIKLLEGFKKSTVSKSNILDWVNIIWFSDWYRYSPREENCIASVMTELEEADEDEDKISNQNIDKYINALASNAELR